MPDPMTPLPDDLPSLRERGERDARFLARAIPEAGRVVALVYGGAGAARSAPAAAGIASAVGLRREHTLLAGTETGPGTLDERIGGAGGPGLWEALEGRARLTEVARRSERRPYTYLPAGASPPSPVALLRAARLRRFAERSRSQGGTLLLHLPEEALGEAGALLDGYVRLGSLAVTAPEGLREYGRVVFAEGSGGAEPPGEVPADGPGPADDPDAAGGPGEGAGVAAVGEMEEPGGVDAPAAAAPDSAAAEGRWRRHRVRGSAPVVRSALGALVVLILVGGWWVLSRESIAGGFGSPESSRGPEPGSDGAAEETVVRPTATAEVLAAAVESAPELPYSVLIASFARASDAEERASDLSASRSELFFVSPTPVRGRLYHRVFAGAREDARAGRELMAELVRSGRKAAASAWDVRPAGLAFRLGVYGSPAAAREAVQEAVAAGVPAYLLAASSTPADTAFQVYAGAYESESAARAMATLLERAGRSAELVERRGLAR